MSETKITDLVPQETIDKIKELDAEIRALLTTYTNTAKELAKGLDVNVRVVGDIDKLEKLLADKVKEAAAATERLNSVMNEQSQVIANTTNTISRQLMEQEKVNKTQREAYTEHDRVKKLLDQYHDTYENQLRSLVKINNELEQNKKAQKDNEKALSMGRVSMTQFTAKQAELIAQHRALTQEKRTLTQIMTAEEKAAQSDESSYVHMSQQLELLKKAYKDLSEEGRNADFGKELEASIQNLDAHLKDVAADMGEFQRNVGNYAIAGQQGVVATDSVIAAMNQEARTTQDLIDQTKILEEAKLMLNKEDVNYQSTLDALNAKIEENKRQLTDVSDILHKDATSVAEAEAQNKRLQEALKHVDLTSDDAQKRIKELNDKIAANTQVIRENTPAIQDQTRAMEQQKKANEGLADNMLNMIGLNTQFGSSLRGLESANTGNVLDGLNTKAKAFGQTLLGLLANPWVLAFLGISGVVAGFKWWYEYNKGIVEATKLTKDLTGLSGDALKGMRNEVQAVADKYGKDFRDVLESANALSKQFGISFQESMGLIEDGFVAGADANGEFVENIKEYPAYFKEAGLSASEFIAITAQANKAGIYSDKGIDVIKEGNLRIREMTKATAEALDGIGISSKEVQKSLTDGSKTTFDIMQEVSGKLAEFPESSSEVGTALADIFGGPGEDAGLQYILTLKDIDTNLDNVKARAGKLGELEEEQLRSQIELENAISAVFDATGGSFEEMTTKAKTYIVQGLTGIIAKCVDIVNWFIRIYNRSALVRGMVEGIGITFKTLWSIVKNVCIATAEELKGIGQILEGVFTVKPELIAKGVETVKNGYKNAAIGIANDFVDAFRQGKNNIEKGHLNEVSINIGNEAPEAGGSGSSPKPKPKTKPKGIPTDSDKKKAEAEAKKQAKEAEKQAKEELKRIHELEEAKVEAMAEGHEKELATIRLKFKKKIDEITGNGETEKALRIQLAEQCENEVGECERKYQEELSKINLENQLAAVEKGSQKELDLRLAMLEKKRAAEINAAEKTGADVKLINDKFDKEREDLEEDHAREKAQKIQEQFAKEQSDRDNAMMSELSHLKQQYAKELQLVGNNEEKRAELKKRYEDKSAEITEKYAILSAQKSVEMLQKTLDTENLSAEDREDLERKLAAAKIALEQSITDATISGIERVTDADAKSKDKRIKNAQQWMQIASDALNAVNDLASTIYDAKIERAEEEQEVNSEAGDKEQERISELVEKKVITEEEGEARKRAAAAKTAKKDEELEKKKQQLKQRQAIWNKANQLAQAGINTAASIMVTAAMLGFPAAIPFIAIAGAMGALQIATILATPIPKYAKGTDNHPGGPAIVGDGGRSEVVLFRGSAWLTPDKPTLVDIPAGAVVIPDINPLGDNPGGMVMMPYPAAQPAPKGYDDAAIRHGIAELAYLIRAFAKQRHRDSYLANYEIYKSQI